MDALICLWNLDHRSWVRLVVIQQHSPSNFCRNWSSRQLSVIVPWFWIFFSSDLLYSILSRVLLQTANSNIESVTVLLSRASFSRIVLQSQDLWGPWLHPIWDAVCSSGSTDQTPSTRLRRRRPETDYAQKSGTREGTAARLSPSTGVWRTCDTLERVTPKWEARR